jgi:hypothetical protein
MSRPAPIAVVDARVSSPIFATTRAGPIARARKWMTRDRTRRQEGDRLVPHAHARVVIERAPASAARVLRATGAVAGPTSAPTSDAQHEPAPPGQRVDAPRHAVRDPDPFARASHTPRSPDKPSVVSHPSSSSPGVYHPPMGAVPRTAIAASPRRLRDARHLPGALSVLTRSPFQIRSMTVSSRDAGKEKARRSGPSSFLAVKLGVSY